MELEKVQGVSPAALDKTAGAPSNLSTGNLEGRAVRILKATPSTIGDFFGSVDGTDKLMKIVTSIMLIVQLKLGADIVQPMVALQRRINEGCKLFKVRRFTGTLDYFAQMRFTKDRIINVASMALLMVSNTCEQLMWMGSLGVLKLGEIAANIGRVPGFAVVGNVAIRNVHMGFAISGLALGALHYFLLSGEERQDVTKCWLKVADNVGKTAVVIASPWALSYGFALLCIAVSAIGLAGIWYRNQPSSAPVKAG